MRCSCSEIRADEKFYRVSMKRDVGNKKTQTRGNTACSKTNILLDQRNQFEWTLPSLIYHPRPTCFPARVYLLVEPQHFERRIPNITGHLSIYVYMLSYFLIRVPEWKILLLSIVSETDPINFCTFKYHIRWIF